MPALTRRPEISAQDLQTLFEEHINNALEVKSASERIRAGVIIAVERDSDGCNWDMPVVKGFPHRTNLIRRVTAELRGRYNLLPLGDTPAPLPDVSETAVALLGLLHKARVGGQPPPTGLESAYKELMAHGLATINDHRPLITVDGERVLRARFPEDN